MKKDLKKRTICLTAALWCWFGGLQAAVFEMGDMGVVGPAGTPLIPDNTAAGVAYRFEVEDPSLGPVASVSVRLQISGGCNGDLYAYLSHGSSFCVLLNRVGASSGSREGYLDAGLNILLQEGASNGDIHWYQQVDGYNVKTTDGSAWQPDARVNYGDGESGRTKGLNSFEGLDAHGSWTLFFADLSPGGRSRIEGWSVGIETVPETPTWVAGLLMLTLLVVGIRKARSAPAPHPVRSVPDEGG